MSAVVRVKQRWDTRDYAEIVSARYDAGALVVGFGDGSEARVPIEALEPPRIESSDWTSVSPGEFWVNVRTATGPIEISWFSLRVLSDPEFDAHVAAASAEGERAAAARLRRFREERGLSVEDLAARADLAPAALRRFEAAEAQPTYAELKRLLALLGRRLSDLAEDDDDDDTRSPGRLDASDQTS